MRKTSSLFLFLIVAFSLSCAKRKRSDAEIREKLIGTWLPDEKLARTLSDEVTYKQDSTFDGFILTGC